MSTETLTRNAETGHRLNVIENDRNVRILYACESGSRVWGMASHDSDFDVRFMYAHPMEHYITVGNRRDVIDLPIDGDYDVTGWDVRKALFLAGKVNISVLEWLWSPISYSEEWWFTNKFREMMAPYYILANVAHHYCNMAASNRRKSYAGKLIRHKSYLYMLRPIAIIRWMERAGGAMAPPTNLYNLVDTVFDGYVRADTRALLDRKVGGDELDVGPSIPKLDDFIDEELLRIADFLPVLSAERTRPDREQLDAFLRWTLITNDRFTSLATATPDLIMMNNQNP